MQDRIVKLEEKLAYLEHTLNELNQVVWQLNQQVTLLKKEWRDVRSSATPVDPTRKPEDEVPPHY